MIISSLSNLLKSVVPISRFNKGEANKIFDEVKRDGIKVVMKNNDPICVLISIDKFLDMEEKMENYQLADEALRRVKMAKGSPLIKHADILARYGYTDDELAANDVE